MTDCHPSRLHDCCRIVERVKEKIIAYRLIEEGNPTAKEFIVQLRKILGDTNL